MEWEVAGKELGRKIQKSSLSTICLTCLGDPKGDVKWLAGYVGRSS